MTHPTISFTGCVRSTWTWQVTCSSLPSKGWASHSNCLSCSRAVMRSASATSAVLLVPQSRYLSTRKLVSAFLTFCFIHYLCIRPSMQHFYCVLRQPCLDAAAVLLTQSRYQCHRLLVQYAACLIWFVHPDGAFTVEGRATFICLQH